MSMHAYAFMYWSPQISIYVFILCQENQVWFLKTQMEASVAMIDCAKDSYFTLVKYYITYLQNGKPL